MLGLNCSRCGRPLTYPFTCQVFKEDGTELQVENKIPEGVEDGKGCVFVYLHVDCAKQGQWSSQKIRKALSGVRAQMREARAQERKLRLVEKRPVYAKLGLEVLEQNGFLVKRSGHRVLLVMPQPIIVRRIQ